MRDLHLAQMLLDYTDKTCCRTHVQRIRSKTVLLHFSYFGQITIKRTSNKHLHLHYTSACSIRLPSNSVQITDVTTINSQDSSVGLVTRYELGSPGFETGREARLSATIQIGPGAH